MATLHKFKLLASQCAVAGSPTRSPTTSPVVHLRRRRRKTLRMLLNRTDRRRFSFQENSTDPQDADDDDDDELGDEHMVPERSETEVRARRKLKDLFVSSPPLEDKVLDKRSEEQEGLLAASTSAAGINTASSTRRSLRPISATFRYRFLRRAWRPVLVAIPE